MRIQGIWDYPDQDQEVGTKHINKTQMFQTTSREPMEFIDEEAGDLVDLKDVSESEHANKSAECTDKVRYENVRHTTNHVKHPLLDLLLDKNVKFRN